MTEQRLAILERYARRAQTLAERMPQIMHTHAV
jgi:hypothetical protein